MFVYFYGCVFVELLIAFLSLWSMFKDFFLWVPFLCIPLFKYMNPFSIGFLSLMIQCNCHFLLESRLPIFNTTEIF